ncbi:hypothetical protein PPL_00540 [Heterostelium album PN500]|uniref:Uncharacterized protein n=1 Tax=Heterostelium pallidum (strain ATCC 26659 / Pp 5 / PN500) TaxID=670386 RepID=D3AWR2_HETP5|nr:hypothetical protein PPL_00540 [Heterostelium album PN500]EFA86735.1 hypothetical protein PPL_00540 [Heterostelium album PN500]|eukprot:XP_020438839.1 hypothetical protein PPL_00540 [Heterostelium album PN500]
MVLDTNTSTIQKKDIQNVKEKIMNFNENYIIISYLYKLKPESICEPLNGDYGTPSFHDNQVVVYNYSCRVVNPRYIHHLFSQPIRVTTNEKNLFNECSCISGHEHNGQYISGIEIKIRGYSNQFIYINAMSYHYNFGQCHLKTIYSDRPLQINDTFTQILILEEPSDHYIDWILGGISLALGSMIIFCYNK